MTCEQTALPPPPSLCPQELPVMAAPSCDCTLPVLAESFTSVDYVPEGFKTPYQLMQIRCALFSKHLRLFHRAAANTQSQMLCGSLLERHTAIVGLSPFTNHGASILQRSDGVCSFGRHPNHTSCPNDLLSKSLLFQAMGLPATTTQSVQLLDKLDLCGSLNEPLVQCREALLSAGVDVDACASNSWLLEMQFSSRLQNIRIADVLGSVLEHLVDSLPLTRFQFQDVVCLPLLQHVYWIDTQYLEDFLRITGNGVLLVMQGAEAEVFHLPRDETIYVFRKCFSLRSVLQWYLHLLAHSQFTAVSNSDEICKLLQCSFASTFSERSIV